MKIQPFLLVLKILFHKLVELCMIWRIKCLKTTHAQWRICRGYGLSDGGGEKMWVFRDWLVRRKLRMGWDWLCSLGSNGWVLQHKGWQLYGKSWLNIEALQNLKKSLAEFYKHKCLWKTQKVVFHLSRNQWGFNLCCIVKLFETVVKVNRNDQTTILYIWYVHADIYMPSLV